MTNTDITNTEAVLQALLAIDEAGLAVSALGRNGETYAAVQKGALSIGIVTVGDEVTVQHYNRGTGDRSARDFGPADASALLAHLTTWATT